MTLRLVLADDHPVVREGLRALLDSEPDFEVVGQAGDGDDVTTLVGHLHPDVVVLDLMMGGRSSLHVTRELAEHSPATRGDRPIPTTPSPTVSGRFCCWSPKATPTPPSGARLYISSRTWRPTERMAMKKLGLRTPVELAVYAVRRGIVPQSGRPSPRRTRAG